MKRCATFFLSFFLLFGSNSLAQQAGGKVSGEVTDTNGAAVPGVTVTLLRATQIVVKTVIADDAGRFSVTDLAPGSYELRLRKPGFADRSAAIVIDGAELSGLKFEMSVESVAENVSVTAETGQAQDKDLLVQQINIVSEASILQRATGVLSQVADEEVGVSMQRTSPTLGGVSVRGLVGRSVATYMDGVRVSQSSGRGGISTFFNLTDASNLRSVEILRGPNSAQYGSDSLGGTISLVTRTPQFGTENPQWHGDFNTNYTSADNSFGGNTSLSYGTRRFGALLNLSSRRVSTLRPADGLDGHAAVTRFLGLPSNIINGSRLPDTAFTQYGGSLRLQFVPRDDQQAVFYYQRGQQDGGKRYDQLLGGDGNLIADLRNLMGDLFYTRYLKQGFGWFDNLSLAFSLNSQREERVNQGGQGQATGAITHEYERTTTGGFNFYVDKRLPARNTFLLGGDIYRDRVNSPAYQLNPVNNAVTHTRPRVPGGSRYINAGLYAQHGWEAIPEKLRFSSALRYSVASYRSRAEFSPLVGARRLWDNDGLRVSNFSGRVGVVASPFKGFYTTFNYSRGFRAPNITDLGTLGLVGNGFEVDFAAAAALGGTIGSTADAAAVSTGRPVQQLTSEASNSYEAGFRYRRGRLDTDLTFFLNDLLNTVTTQSLILPAGAAGRSLGGQTITSQQANGVVFVPASTTPVLVRANFGDTRINGIEYTLDYKISGDWTFGGNFTLIRAFDKATGLAPNLEGGIPPANVFLRLRYQPTNKRYWIEAYTTLADRLTRLSTLNLADRRTGGTRTRAQIANFFNRGARVRGLTNPGPDGIFGNADDRLTATNEILSQVQTRVLGTANSAPLFPHLPGYGLFNVRAGFRLGERSLIGFDFENITDQAYRGPSWGIDGPGRSLTARYQYRF